MKEADPLPSVDILVLVDNDLNNPVEVGSAGRHKELPRRFNITLKTGGNQTPQLWSGCLGLGLTRLAAVFLKKYGFNANSGQWPARVTDAFHKAED
jgi:hypothetical protein